MLNMKDFWDKIGSIAHDNWENWANCKYQVIPNFFKAIHGYTYNKYCSYL